MTIKEAIVGYQLLDNLAQEIGKYAVNIGYILPCYSGASTICDADNDRLIVQVYYSLDYTVINIPVTYVENNTWKEYLDKEMEKRKVIKIQEEQERIKAEKAEYERLKKIYG